MRSETAPMWATFMLALGLMLVVAAAISLARGELKLSRTNIVSKAEQPEKYWAFVIGYFVIGVPVFLYGAAYWGPGG